MLLKLISSPKIRGFQSKIYVKPAQSFDLPILVPAQFQNFQFTGLLLSFPIPVPLRLSQAADETQYAGHRGDGYALRSKIDVKALPWRLQDASFTRDAFRHQDDMTF